eukprot:11526325-Prorocentrum_lima.AAC.1
MGTSNLGIIGSALATAQKLGLHCCIGGEFNNGGEVVRNSGVLEFADAYVFQPKGPTCITSTSSSCIDFFVVNGRLKEK